MPSVSVLIPTFNRRETLKRAIQSVFHQSFEDFELIVIDDASTDETLDYLQSLNDSRLEIVSLEKNRGVSYARNRGFDKARGEWIALLDSDDEWLPHRLETQFRFAKENPEIPLIHGEEIWVRKGKRVNPKKIHQKSGGRIFSRALHLCLISPSATLMKSSLYKELGGFREDYPVCEDYEMWLRVTCRHKIGFIEDPIITKYGGHEDQLSGRFFAMDYWRVKAMDEISKSHGEFITSDEMAELAGVIRKKCEILKQGYLKHGNLEDLPYVEELLSRWQSKV